MVLAELKVLVMLVGHVHDSFCLFGDPFPDEKLITFVVDQDGGRVLHEHLALNEFVSWLTFVLPCPG